MRRRARFRWPALPAVGALGVLLALGISACGHRPAPPAAAAPPLRVRQLAYEHLPDERALDGLIEAVNQGTVSAETSGRVDAIYYDVNDFVPKGAVIVRLRSTQQRASLGQAEASMREAMAREADAQSAYTRVSALFERGLVARNTRDEALANRDAAVARLQAARAAQSGALEGVGYTEIRAPYAGIVTKRHVELGESVGPGTLIMSGLSLRYLRVSVDVPQSIVEQVRRTRKAAIYVGGRRVEATHLTVFPEADAGSGTFRARLELPENATDLYPGMYVKVALVVGEADQLRVPRGALVERGELDAVYVVAGDGSVHLRQVRLGHRNDNEVEVLAGLQAGERVALDPVAAERRQLATVGGRGGA